MKGAIARAEGLAAQVPNAWIPQQFDNPANADIHASTTAQEVLADFARWAGRARSPVWARAGT